MSKDGRESASGMWPKEKELAMSAGSWENCGYTNCVSQMRCCWPDPPEECGANKRAARRAEKTEEILAFYQLKYLKASELLWEARKMIAGNGETWGKTELLEKIDATLNRLPDDAEAVSGCLIHGRVGVDGKCPRC